MRFDGLERLGRVVKLRIGRGQIIELVVEIGDLVLQRLGLCADLGQSRFLLSDLGLSLCEALFSLLARLIVSRTRIPGFPVDFLQPGVGLLLLPGDFGFDVCGLCRQGRKPLFGGETLRLHVGKLCANGRHPLLCSR